MRVAYIDSLTRAEFFTSYASSQETTFLTISPVAHIFLRALRFNSVLIQKPFNLPLLFNDYTTCRDSFNVALFETEINLGWSLDECQSFYNLFYSSLDRLRKYSTDNKQPLSLFTWNSEFAPSKIMQEFCIKHSLDIFYFEKNNISPSYLMSTSGTNQHLNQYSLATASQAASVLQDKVKPGNNVSVLRNCARLASLFKYSRAYRYHIPLRIPCLPSAIYSLLTLRSNLAHQRENLDVFIMQVPYDSSLNKIGMTDYYEAIRSYVNTSKQTVILRPHPLDNTLSTLLFVLNLILHDRSRVMIATDSIDQKYCNSTFVTYNSSLGFKLLVKGYNVKTLGPSFYDKLTRDNLIKLYEKFRESAFL